MKLISPEAAKHISNLRKELGAIEPESVLFEPIPVSVTKQEQVGNKICPSFFDADPVNNCTDEDLAGFKSVSGNWESRNGRIRVDNESS